MPSTEYFVGLPEDARSFVARPDTTIRTDQVTTSMSEIVWTADMAHVDDDNGVPNAPKSSIGEIFSSDATDSVPIRNGSISRPRAVRDTPTRPRDTHSRLFGQSSNSSVAPMVTDTIRSNIQFGDGMVNGNGHSPSHSPVKSLANGSVASTPSRGETDAGDHSSYSPPKRNPVTGDGVELPKLRRRHPAAGLRGADPTDPTYLPQPNHKYITTQWPPNPADYYVRSTIKPNLSIQQTPYSLIGLDDQNEKLQPPVIDPDSLSPQPVLNGHWPPFPALHYLEPQTHTIPYHPLPEHAFVGMTSALGDRPKPDYKYNPIPTLDGPVDPYLIANTNPPPTLFKYERDGPIPDCSLLETPVAPGPRTLTGFPPIFHKHVPGYLFKNNRNIEDFDYKTYFVDYVRQREMGWVFNDFEGMHCT